MVDKDCLLKMASTSEYPVDSTVVVVKCPRSEGNHTVPNESVAVNIDDESDKVSEHPSTEPLLLASDSKCKFAARLEQLHQAGQHSILADDYLGSHEELNKTDGCVLSFHQVSYEVEETVKGCCCCAQKSPKKILSNISGLCKPGMNAILGPTGCGKTSLLDILAARKEPQGLRGEVLVNGKPQPSNFKCMAGYVVQDDIVMGMLTVRENIQFSAALRLSSSMSVGERNSRVEDILADLGLTKCADTRVGTDFIRGISGGERKRTNIAMELITAPQVLFLDEPTTGLDAHTAYSVMYLLQRLSRRGKTIIFSVHQPRFSIFRLIDELMLLSQGEMLYHGPAKDALEHFNSIGFRCEEHNNPPDFFLDVLNGGLMPESCPARLPPDVLQTNGTSHVFKESEAGDMFALNIEEDADLAGLRQRVLVDQYTVSKYHTRVENLLEPIVSGVSQSDATATEVKVISYSSSFLTQFYVVSGRTWKNMVRNRHTLITQMMSAILLGTVIGGIYFQADDSYTSGIQNRVGAFFFMVMNYVFGNMSAVDVFIKDRAIFIHESISGFYRVSSYFLSKLIFDVLPQRALPVITFASISYWMIGLVPGAPHFFFFCLNLFLTCMAGTSVALVFSASTSNHTVGTIFTALVWVFMMIFSGLLVNIQSIPSFLRWLQWLSIFRFSMDGFMVNELKDRTFCDYANSTSVCDTGNEYMRRQGIPYQTSWDLWQNEAALAIITLIFLILTYIQLRSMKKLK